MESKLAIASLQDRLSAAEDRLEQFICWYFSREEEIIYEKVCPEAKAPEKAHDDDAAWDVFSREELSILPGDVVVVNTGVRFLFPEKTHMWVTSKSGLASKSKIQVFNSPATIDCPYRGELAVILYNAHKTDEFKISVGQKLAQVKMFKDEIKYKFTEGKVDQNSSRGTAGFGSSGL